MRFWSIGKKGYNKKKGEIAMLNNTAGLNAYLAVQLGSRSMEHEERRKLYLELPNQTCRTNVELLK